VYIGSATTQGYIGSPKFELQFKLALYY
jgi:hypothetical protein